MLRELTCKDFLKHGAKASWRLPVGAMQAVRLLMDWSRPSAVRTITAKPFKVSNVASHYLVGRQKRRQSGLTERPLHTGLLWSTSAGVQIKKEIREYSI